ncbi:hypothetical protein HZ326_26657 [Fusarium oxysporum f. sp. albedinis]|nr:hypothetical protein HZ326_26657 [Fusarium oxysporum f. sp. albedinis]
MSLLYNVVDDARPPCDMHSTRVGNQRFQHTLYTLTAKSGVFAGCLERVYTCELLDERWMECKSCSSAASS